nr:hypothetical protein GZ27E7_32 [uncultured archaeon GZfos27E7]
MSLYAPNYFIKALLLNSTTSFHALKTTLKFRNTSILPRMQIKYCTIQHLF